MPTAETASVQLYFLGPPRFSRGGQPVELSAAKATALLAYLAATYIPQSRERVLDLLWPESSPEAARKNLRNTLWAIRKAFGDDILHAADDRLALNQGVWVDIEAFAESVISPASPIAQAQAKIELYRGPFLDGLTLTDAPDFEIWLVAERERLDRLYTQTLAALIESYRNAGQWAEMVETAHRALAHDNLQEPMYRALMEAHARLGERAEALRQYDTLQATLARELGVEPLPETQLLRTAILNGDLQPISPAQATARPAPAQESGMPAASPTTLNIAAAPFIGRQAECAALEAELQLALGGQARAVLISGEIGIGKSRLWQVWSGSLPPDPQRTVLEIYCRESTRTLPFAPLTAVFGSTACLRHLFTPPSPVPPIWLAEVARLLPQIRLSLPDLPAPAVLPPEEERRRIFEALVQCLAAINASLLLLFVDDLHWADQTTLDWLDYLLHRLQDQPLLLIATYRPEDASSQLTHTGASWSREGLARRISLAPLTPAETIQLITALGGDEVLAERLQVQSAGNPYFLLELCRTAPNDVPPALVELISARLARLPDPAQQILQAAAVLEPDFSFTTLRRTAGRSEEETLDALDALLAAGVLVEPARLGLEMGRDSQYGFAHPLVATVVRTGLSGARRAFLHRRAAEAREKIHAGNLPTVAGRLADHYLQANDPSRSATYAEMAAEHALSLAASAEAVHFYRQALALQPTPARQLGLGQALHRQGELAAAQAAFEAALAEFSRQGDRRGAAEACFRLADISLPTGQADQTIFWAEKSLTYLQAEDIAADPAAHASVHLLLGTGILRTATTNLAEAEAHLVEAARLAGEHELAEIAARTCFEQGNLLAQQGDLTGAIRAFQEALRMAQAMNDQYLEVLAHNNAAYHSLLAGDLPAAHEHINLGLSLAEARALDVPLQYLYSTRGEIALAEQDWAAAESWFQRGLIETRKYHNLPQAANYQANLGLAARGRGDLDSALLFLETAYKEAASLNTPHLQTQIDLWLVEVYLERGERAAAQEALARAEVRLTRSQRRGLQAWAERLWQNF